MLPYFYFDGSFTIGTMLVLPTEVSKHAVSVLRMKEGSGLILTNGKGEKAQVQISHADKYKTHVTIVSIHKEENRNPVLWAAVGFTKNRNRNEWFLEKLVEIGVDVIIPLHCQNSEREKLNYERMNQVMVAAMIQSQRTFLPAIQESISPEKAVGLFKEECNGSILMAHCEEDDKKSFYHELQPGNALILIGPEGDFSQGEITRCKSQGAIPVSLGPARLRTETAAIYACTIFNQQNYAL